MKPDLPISTTEMKTRIPITTPDSPTTIKTSHPPTKTTPSMLFVKTSLSNSLTSKKTPKGPVIHQITFRSKTSTKAETTPAFIKNASSTGKLLFKNNLYVARIDPKKDYSQNRVRNFIFYQLNNERYI